MNKMKSLLLILSGSLIIYYIAFSLIGNTTALTEVPVNSAFDDINFYKCVVDTYKSYNFPASNITYTTNLTDEQLASLTVVSCPSLGISDDEKIVSVKGVEKLVSLKNLSLVNQKIKKIDVSKNKKLELLKLGDTNWGGNYGNLITEINLTNNLSLTELDLTGNQLTSLDISKNTALTSLGVGSNQLTSLDISKNTKLTKLDVSSNKLTNLLLSNNVSLTSLKAGWNQLKKLDISKNTLLTNLSVSNNQITSLDVSRNTALTEFDVNSNQITSLDVSKNVKLKTLNVYYNQLLSIDLSKNLSLTNIRLDSNPFGKSYNLKIGETAKMSDPVILPSGMENSVASWSSDRTSVATVNSSTGLVTAVNGGIATVKASTSKYTLTNTINVISLSSDKYVIDNNNLIVLSYDSDATTIKNNIKVPSGMTVTVSTADNKIYLKNGNVTVGTYKLVIAKSSTFDLSKDYIYFGSGSVDTSKITVTNGTASISGNKILIKSDTVILKEYNVVKISSESYADYLSKDYIYVGIGSFGKSHITTTNASIEEVQRTGPLISTITVKIKIKYKDVVLKEYDIVSIRSTPNIYLASGYIYMGVKDFDTVTNSVVIVNGTAVVNNNKLLFKYKTGDTVLKEIDLIGVSSDVYDLSGSNIYVGANDLDISKIKVINGTGAIVDGKFVIKNNINGASVYKYTLSNFKFNNYVISGKNITVPSNVSYNTFINDIVGSEELTFKLFNGTMQVTSGNVLVDYKLKVYYNNKEIDEYTVVNEYLNFDTSLDVDKNKNIINNIKSGTNINNIFNKISTSGQIFVLDKDNNIIESKEKLIGTGNMFKIVLGSQTLYYVVSVKGDLNSNGNVEVNDLVQVSKHVVKGNVITGIEYFNASDINNDTKIDINDVIKMAKHIVKKTEL